MSKAKAETSKEPVIRIEFKDNSKLQELCGRHDANLQQIEDRLGVQLVPRGNRVAILGHVDQAKQAKVVLEDLYKLIDKGMSVSAPQVDAALRVSDGLIDTKFRPADLLGADSVIKTPLKKIAPRSVQQHVYVSALQHSSMVFGLGPAGTGKTYLAMAMAVSLLMQKKVNKLILTRPVVEAGESLGFLPGTLEEKVDPYLRPLFDALDETLGREKADSLREQGIIEIAPLAYMRGRTLANCCMVLDEAQNTTKAQMKMFLTRLGENGRAIITGDPSQADLPRHETSGLVDALKVLEGVKDIDVVRFTEADVVRHDLVTRIVQAYDHRDRQIGLELGAKDS